MVSYVVYKASEEFKNRRLIAKRLKTLGCRCIRRSFWEVDEERVNDVLNVLRGNQPILLKRLREVRRSRFDRENNLIDFGSLVVFVYKSGKKDRVDKIRSLLKKAPCIRLCNGVYAFCQEPSFFEGQEGLIDAKLFWILAKEIDETIRVFPRTVIVNSESAVRLLEDVKMRIEKEINDVAMGYRTLYQKAINGEVTEKDSRREQMNLKRKFVLIKRLAVFYEKWLKIDFSNIVTRPYPFMRKTRLISIEQRKKR